MSEKDGKAEAPAAPKQGVPDASKSWWDRLRSRITGFFGAGVDKSGSRQFGWILSVLLLLIAAYVIGHTVTIVQSPYLHSEASSLSGARLDWLVQASGLKREIDTPAALTQPGVEAVLGRLKVQIMASESITEATPAFAQATEGLVQLALPADADATIRDATTTRMSELLKTTRDAAANYLLAEGSDKEVAWRLLEIELDQSQSALLDYVAIPGLLTNAQKLQTDVQGLGYNADTAPGKLSTLVVQELQSATPDRRLAADLLNRAVEQIQGLRQSLFWTDPYLRWLEVVAWSLAGILCIRLLSAGKFIGTNHYEPKWNLWWWAKVVNAPILAVAVVALLTYLKLDMTSQETFGIKLSLSDQPIEVIIAVSLIIGLFSDRAFEFLRSLAEKLFPDKEGDKEKAQPPEVPNVMGLLPDAAKRKLEELFVVGTREQPVDDPDQVGKVIDREPDSPKLAKGSALVLFVGKEKE